jgi:hypothetical protein
VRDGRPLDDNGFDVSEEGVGDACADKADAPHRPSPSELLVIGPFWLQTMLSEYNLVEPLCYSFVDAEQLLPTKHLLTDYFADLGVEVRTCRVVHSYPAYGIGIRNLTTVICFFPWSFLFMCSTHEQDTDWGSIVYSGDTRPCTGLVELFRAIRGQGASLLIHEANFSDSMHSKAVSDRHSTYSEVLHLASHVEADVTLLTHFSNRLHEEGVPRLSLLPRYGEYSTAAIAHDYFCFPLRAPFLQRRTLTEANYLAILQQLYETLQC